MSRTRKKGFFPATIAAAGWLAALLCASAQAFAAPLKVSTLQRNGKPLVGTVLTLESSGPPMPPATPIHAIVDQLDLTFVPDVLIVPVGSTISFPNSDAVSHQVYSFSPVHRFQLPLYRGKPYPPVQFDQPGVVTLGCNIHDNMLAYIFVTGAPFFGRSDAKGEWLTPDLPKGSYRLRVWHPLLNEPSGDVVRTLETGGSSPPDLTVRLTRALRPAPLKGRPHSWDY
ncbi:MAG: methylamine utilization protein [Gammaproteobacteria bacterium]